MEIQNSHGLYPQGGKTNTLASRFSRTLLSALKYTGKKTGTLLGYMGQKKRAILGNSVWLSISLILSFYVYYLLFPLKVYQTKRSDRLLQRGNEDALIAKLGMIEYGINDEESNVLMNMLAGMGDQESWKHYLTDKGYEITDMDTVPNDFGNPALYKALRETHIMAFSPKVRLEPRNGSFKHFSNGKIAYTDHRNHRVYSYYLLNNGMSNNQPPSLAAYLDSKTYEHDREKLQEVLCYHFLSEFSHTYALGTYKHDYIERFLHDAFPGVDIVKDSFPYTITTNIEKKDTLIRYSEHNGNVMHLITRYTQKDSVFTDTILKEDLTHLWRDLYLNTNNYNESYKEGFEDRIHEGVVEKTLARYFIETYEKHLNPKSNRELYDYARILLGSLGYLHYLDTERGKGIMLLLANKGYNPAVRFVSRRNNSYNFFSFAPQENKTQNRKRNLVSSYEIQICTTGGRILQCFEEYDEKSTHYTISDSTK